jgi:hypothetical protein
MRLPGLPSQPVKLKEMAKEQEPKQPMPAVSQWAGPVALGWLNPWLGEPFSPDAFRRGALQLASVTRHVPVRLDDCRVRCFKPQTGDFASPPSSTTGGILGDRHAPAFLYLLSVRVSDYNQRTSQATRRSTDYGTKVSGLPPASLNNSGQVDAFEIAVGRKD